MERGPGGREVPPLLLFACLHEHQPGVFTVSHRKTEGWLFLMMTGDKQKEKNPVK